MNLLKKNMRPLCALMFTACLWWCTSCSNPPYEQGEILYQNFCGNCHMEDGKGLQGIIPPLAGADYVKHHPAGVACAIRKGIEGEIMVNDTLYNQPMAAIKALNDVEITNIINYICQAWGNDYGTVTLGDVKKALEACE